MRINKVKDKDIHKDILERNYEYQVKKEIGDCQFPATILPT